MERDGTYIGKIAFVKYVLLPCMFACKCMPCTFYFSKVGSIGAELSGVYQWAYVLLNIPFGIVITERYMRIFGNYKNYELVKEKFCRLYLPDGLVVLLISGVVNIMFFFIFHDILAGYFDALKITYELIVVMVFYLYVYRIIFVQVLPRLYGKSQMDLDALKSEVSRLKMKLHIVFLFSTMFTLFMVISVRYMNPYLFLMIYLLVLISGYGIYMTVILNSSKLKRLKVDNREKSERIIKMMELTRSSWVPGFVWNFLEILFDRDIRDFF